MSAGTLLLAAAALLAAVMAVVCLYTRWAKQDLRRLARYEHWTDRFFAAAKPLVSDPDTPPDVLDLLATVNDVITAKPASRLLYYTLKKQLLCPRAASVDRPFEAFFAQRPELSEPFGDACYAGLMAITYLDRRWGERSRALLAELAEGKRRTAAIVQEVREVSDRFHARHGSLQPA